MNELLARKTAQTSFQAYIEYTQTFRPEAHHRLMIEALEGVERGDTPKLMLLMPPGSAKSTYTSATFPAWYLGRNPQRSVIAASHTQEMAERFGRRVRNLYSTQEHRNVFSVGVAGDSNAAHRWDTDQGGEYYAAGVGGPITGRRADLGLIDDPVKGREEADSERMRNRVWEWYVNDFLTRLKPGAAQILVMTRWHEDDLGGRILERERDQWKVIELAMEALPDDPLGRETGDRLWPEWFTDEMVETAKMDVRGWNALYQQRPATEAGDYFLMDWFSDYEDLPEKMTVYGASDYAVTDGDGDYTEHGVFGVDAWSNIHVMDWWRGQKTSDVWIDAKCDMIIKHKPVCWFGEAGPIRRAVEPYLNKRMTERHAFCRLEWLASISDKAARCRPFQALASMGKVRFPKSSPWKAELIGQLVRFPAGKHDDGVDVCSLIGRGLEHVAPPRIKREHPRAAPPRSAGGSGAWQAG